MASFIKIEIYRCKPHQLCNGKCAHLKCCRLWVWALVGSNKRPKTEKLVFDSSPLSTQPSEVITTGWLRIRIMFSSGASCETAYSTSHNFYIILNLFLSSICMSLKYCSLDVKQLSINQPVYFTWRNELVAMETWLMISIWSKIDPFSYIYLREVSVSTDVRKRQSMIWL